MVTISIMIIMTSVVLFNYNRFNESTLLSGAAYDLSLTVRQAQVYGVAARQGTGSQSGIIDVSTTITNAFKLGYGVNFNRTGIVVPPLTPPPPVAMFIDSGTVPNSYDSADSTIQSYSFQRGIKIADLCVTPVGSATTPQCNLSSLSVAFKRPDPEAIIVGAGNINAGLAQIVLSNADGSMKKSVFIYSTGQISVQ